MPAELMKQKINHAQEFIDSHKSSALKGHWRQQFHFMPEVGWMNDPNGMIEYHGKYHFFYQYNPFTPFWDSMYWGHAVSDDMIHWEYLPPALAPSEDYDNHQKGGCFSGSAIEKDGRLFLIYTGTYNNGDGFKQVQCVAYSDDGIHFAKYEGNPVLTAPEGYEEANFRDPCVWEHEGNYYMVCGASKDHLAQALLFKSSDLFHWDFVNVLAESYGDLGYMWECPDFFELDGRYVLLISPMGAGNRTAIYLVGDFDYNTGKFTYVINGNSDNGFDFYAPKSFKDHKGRRMVVAWANEWDWMPRWKDWGPTYKENWCGSFNLIREVKLNKDNTLSFLPIEEYQAIRTEGTERTFLEVSDIPFTISEERQACEIQAVIDLTSSDALQVVFSLKGNNEYHLDLILDLEHQMVTLDRNQADGWSRGETHTELKKHDRNNLTLDIFIDRSSVEVFIEDYHTVLSSNVFAADNQLKNTVYAVGGTCRLKKLKTFQMAVGE